MSSGWALVTGGARRVGRAIALELAAMGYDIVIHYHRSHEAAYDTSQAIEALGRKTVMLSADLRDTDDIAQLFVDIQQRCGSLTVLVNSASDFPRIPFDTVTVEQWDSLVNLNLRGPFFCAQAAARMMTKGVIINLSDVGADIPWPSYLPYSMSKAGIDMLTKGLALILAPDIRVAGVAPGVVLLPDEWDEKKHPPAQRVPLNRMGTPDDVARTVRFLVESSYITGETIAVDGGRRWG